MDINELATATMAKGKRKNKKLAFDTILKIIEQSELLEGVGTNELINLYSFFSVTASKKTDYWAWLNSLVSKDETRKKLMSVWVEDEYVYGSDEFVLGRVKNTDNLENGFYDKNKTKLNYDFSPLMVIPLTKGLSFLETHKLSEPPKTILHENTENYIFYDNEKNEHKCNKLLFERGRALKDMKQNIYFSDRFIYMGSEDLCCLVAKIV